MTYNEKKRQQKREARIETAFTATIVLILLIVIVWGCHLDATYKARGQITNINTSTMEVEFIDNKTDQKFVYYVKSFDKEKVGKTVKATIDHNGTESYFEDDKVVNAKVIN